MSEVMNTQSESTPNQGQGSAVSNAGPQKPNQGHTGRKVVVGFLIFLGLVFFVLANIAFWAWFTLLNTNGWVAAVGPLSKDPVVSSIISQAVVAELTEQVDLQQATAEMLPEEMQFFSGPLSVGLQSIVEDTVTSLIQSEAFNTVWVGLNRTAHTAIMKVLKGNGDLLYMQTGDLILDLSDIYNFIEDRFELPDLNLFPQAEDGRVVLLHSQKVAILQEVVLLLNTIGLLLPLFALIAFGIAVWISLWRRETLIWIGAFVMVISLIIFSLTRSYVMVSIIDPLLRDLGRQIWNVVTHGLMVQTIFFMIVGIMIAIGAWQSAPDSWFMQWEAARKLNE